MNFPNGTYYFIWSKTGDEADINFLQKWNDVLTLTSGADQYFILDDTGMLIDAEGFPGGIKEVDDMADDVVEYIKLKFNKDSALIV